MRMVDISTLLSIIGGLFILIQVLIASYFGFVLKTYREYIKDARAHSISVEARLVIVEKSLREDVEKVEDEIKEIKTNYIARFERVLRHIAETRESILKENITTKDAILAKIGDLQWKASQQKDG